MLTQFFAGPNQPQVSIAGAGDVSLNIIGTENTYAFINDLGTIIATDAPVTVRSEDETASGRSRARRRCGMNESTQTSSVGLAGSVSINVDARRHPRVRLIGDGHRRCDRRGSQRGDSLGSLTAGGFRGRRSRGSHRGISLDQRRPRLDRLLHLRGGRSTSMATPP